MCGISGFTGEPNHDNLLRMNNSISHRGPNSAGYFENANASLAMRRLSIVDLLGGDQPYFNETNNIVVVFNGEIYNHSEFRGKLELKGHQFRTSHADGEVIAHAFEEYGDLWPQYVNGMFAVALWDKRDDSMHLFRDRLGKKPLYYSIKGGELFFCSEIKGILQVPNISNEINYKALGNYFSDKNIAAPNTVYENIKQLMPGAYLKWQNQRIVESRRYWNNAFDRKIDVTEEIAAETIYDLITDSVKLRMQCDVPFGAYLSGGVDSSAIVSIMSKYSRKPIKTFCLGYKDIYTQQFQSKNQDILHARKMAKMLGTEHHELFINDQDFVDAVDSICMAFDEPFSGTVSTFFLTKLISKHVKVAISGDGADELFASYLPQRLAFPIANYLMLLKNGKNQYSSLSKDEYDMLIPFNNVDGFDFIRRIASEKINVWRDELSVFTVNEKCNLLNKDYFPEESLRNPYDDFVSKLTQNDILNMNLEIDQSNLLANQILPFVDRLSMAHSVEVRCPFLDYRLVEYVNGLAGTMKIKSGVNKYILKMALRNELPEDLINRPKEGFVQPIYSWMHASLKPWINDMLQDLPSELFNAEYLRSIIKKYNSGDININAKIWNLVCFSIWWQNRGKAIDSI